VVGGLVICLYLLSIQLLVQIYLVVLLPNRRAEPTDCEVEAVVNGSDFTGTMEYHLWVYFEVG
jgi:hypothetical protein